ncbi:hypothetical protein GRI75_08205 [Altererythrobacter soli]|uniref:Inositolphosphotransferase Aur1/Ipt1 domain-containing protein n=1 Tax=Croceibacterium soli TaxID=1739690 RepID=A0A6I4UVT0_9SPHN|nr:phosphatase PAP2 family protein [Croceibacterium soli]MXP41623.1 hypothetical protein [Croceibacterium soli]
MRELLRELRRGAAADRAILLALCLTWAGYVALLAGKGINALAPQTYRLNFNLYLAALLVSLVLGMASVLARHRPASPIRFVAASFVSSGVSSQLVRGIPMLLALVIFLPVFGSMKSAIPLFSSYTWDDTWIALDRALHGTDPWRILQPVFGYPLVTSILAGFYHLWILLIYAGGVGFCFFVGDRQLRAQFFVAYFACWALLGNGLAITLASVGPCFVGPMLGDPRFDEQMAYLKAANAHYPVMTLAVQQQLIDWYTSGSGGLGRGISAMPSMHVSIAFLFFLAMRRISRIAGLLFGAFFVIIMIGSVHLAYHYAVDGYVSIAATWLIWLAAGAAARRIARADGAVELPVAPSGAGLARSAEASTAVPQRDS